jgi:ABC-2 type transport system permease protein
MNLFFAFLFRDFAIERNYRFHLLIKAASAFFQFAIFYFLSRFLQQPDYFSFLFAGLLFSRFFQFWLNAFTENVRQEQYWGTAELIFLAPQPPLMVAFSSTAGKFALLVLELAVYALIGRFVFNAHFLLSPAFVLLFLIDAAAFAGLGLLAGSFILYFKRGDPVNWLVAGSFDLLSGVYFPLSVLPKGLRLFSAVLPTTVALDEWRNLLLSGNALSLKAAGVQAVWAVALIAAGTAAFRVAFQATRRKGELGSY